MAYRDLVSELAGSVPRLPYPLAQKYLQRAWEEIQDMRLWSFLVDIGDIVSPQMVSQGTVTVTAGASTVELDFNAMMALIPLVFGTPPLAHPEAGRGRQFRVSSGEPVYSIIGADFNGPYYLFLDRPYAGLSATGSPYLVYKCYYAPPSTNFLRYLTIVNARAGYSIRGRKLYYTQQKLNAVDPQRGANGDAYVLASWKPDSTGLPVHEWYPHPVNQAVYNCGYQRRKSVLGPSVGLPATLPEGLLMSRALTLAADWALSNVGSHPELQQTNWPMFRQTKREEFKEGVIQAIKQDDELFLQYPPFVQGGYLDFPLGGEFLQGHDVSSLVGGLQ